MILGNIVSNEQIDTSPNYKYYTFDTIMGLDDSLPTLYVGYTNTKTLLGNIDPLTHEINKNTFWCNTKKENNRAFVTQYFKFQMFAHKYYVKDLEYIYVNVLTQESKELLQMLFENQSDLVVIYSKKDSFYVKLNNIVYGFSISSLRYLGFDIKKLFLSIKKRDIELHNFEKMSVEIKRFSLVLGSEMYSSVHY